MKEIRNKIPVTVQIVLIKENKILLMKRYNTGYEDGRYSLPGGHVEKGEEIKQAAIREVNEEIGVEIDKENLEVLHVLYRKVEDNAYVDFILECKEWSGEIEIKEKDKCNEIKWADITNLPCNVIPFIKKIFTKEHKGEYYISYGWEE